ncbi:hypothetical protein D9611_009939 [Ephemerocybe angulata]|uniref:Uncharacterized protein n=1 Tax=Ephemerocybe angulata TaxID=980116 RepID=A0A8H5C4E4_9AGAR|nr:hypothetical protein D9611_009939 [Tulosesus angulatus]
MDRARDIRLPENLSEAHPKESIFFDKPIIQPCASKGKNFPPIRYDVLTRAKKFWVASARQFQPPSASNTLPLRHHVLAFFPNRKPIRRDHTNGPAPNANTTQATLHTRSMERDEVQDSPETFRLVVVYLGLSKPDLQPYMRAGRSAGKANIANIATTAPIWTSTLRGRRTLTNAQTSSYARLPGLSTPDDTRPKHPPRSNLRPNLPRPAQDPKAPSPTPTTCDALSHRGPTARNHE